MHESIYTLAPLLEEELNIFQEEPTPRQRLSRTARLSSDSKRDELCDPREFRARWWAAPDCD